MKNIADYKPFRGFYDLRDYNLPKKDFIKFWNMQEYLHHVESNKKYFKKMDKNMWEQAQQLSANYQQCLFSYSGKKGKQNEYGD
jgi:hypothetical protein